MRQAIAHTRHFFILLLICSILLVEVLALNASPAQAASVLPNKQPSTITSSNASTIIPQTPPLCAGPYVWTVVTNNKVVCDYKIGYSGENWADVTFIHADYNDFLGWFVYYASDGTHGSINIGPNQTFTFNPHTILITQACQECGMHP